MGEPQVDAGNRLRCLINGWAGPAAIAPHMPLAGSLLRLRRFPKLTPRGRLNAHHTPPAPYTGTPFVPARRCEDPPPAPAPFPPPPPWPGVAETRPPGHAPPPPAPRPGPPPLPRTPHPSPLLLHLPPPSRPPDSARSRLPPRAHPPTPPPPLSRRQGARPGLHDEAGKVPARSVHDDGDAGRGRRQVTRPAHRHVADLRQAQLPAGQYPNRALAVNRIVCLRSLRDLNRGGWFFGPFRFPVTDAKKFR